MVDNKELDTTETVKEKGSKAPISLEKKHDLMVSQILFYHTSHCNLGNCLGA